MPAAKGITKTAGNWDRDAWPVYFISASIGTLVPAAPLCRNLLVAVNELREHDLAQVQAFIKAKNYVLIDSGVYWLSTQHARAHNITMDQALGLAPDEIDGFAELLERYVKINKSIGHKSWGYIEIDQGGRENKIKTRAKLEKMGLAPIPVYHPINDGWDYFDYLAERYDRICFGNIVAASQQTRVRLMATMWERRRKYPHLWVHVLGMTPGHMTSAYPMQSCDSSTWIWAVRWGGGPQAHIANTSRESIGPDWCYEYGSDANSAVGVNKATALCGYQASLMERSMHVMLNEQQDVLNCSPMGFQNAARR